MGKLSSIFRIISVLWIGLGAMMLLCMICSTIIQTGDHMPLFKAGGSTVALGLLLFLLSGKPSSVITKREGYLIVTLSWVSVAFFSSLPFHFSGVTGSFSNSWFESVSGLTTTGSTIIRELETVPEGILLWRSLTQWIGGMGIIVLTVAIFPLLGIGGIELFGAEAPGPTSDKIHPRIRETAKRLWYIYLGLTGILILLLKVEGMTWFDSINHALTCMATGGFSTKNESIAFFTNPAIQYTLILFMFIAGTNYAVLYFWVSGRFRQIVQNDEYKVYIFTVLFISCLAGFGIYLATENGFEQSIRTGLFNVISLITTTGYVTDDYTAWSPWLTMVFFALMFGGACAGSTSGGIKLIRHLVFFKNSVLEFKRILHPRALIRIKINQKIVAPRILTHILVFLLIYLCLFAAGTLTLSVLGVEFETAVGAAATSIGNVGPGIGQVGPEHTFADLPSSGKWTLSFLMLCGRLELFTILVLFTPYFWKS